jgi:Lipoprotein LpqB beta-propeller domain/Sporulation and spore germination
VVDGRRRVAGALVALTLVTGCANIPTSGEVVEGDAVPEQLPVSVGFEPDSPEPGASETGIVQGFLEAMASYQPGYSTAKEFLTPDARSGWNPGDAMTIYSANPDVTQTGDGAVRLTLTVAAVITPEAGYERRAPATTTKIDLILQTVDEEWRIANPPQGLLVFEGDFEAEFREYNLYYFAPDFESLVPDPVYVPTQGNVAFLLAEALVRGPSGWLAPAVHTAFPVNTTVELPVTVEAGRAQVDLSADVAEGTSEQQREQMTAQLAWTLEQVDGIQQVVVRADGLPLTDAEATAGPAESFGEFDPNRLRGGDLYAITDAGVVAGDRLAPVPGALGDLPGLRRVAVEPRAGRAAVVDSTGKQLLWAPLDGSAEPTPLAAGADLGAVSWDRTGLVWAVDHVGGGSTIMVVAPGSDGVPVEMPDALSGRNIADLAVSPDGSRIALAVEGDVLVGIVLRDAEVSSASIEGLRRVQLGDRTVTRVDWSRLTELAVLVHEPGQAAEPYRVGLGGSDLSPAGPVQGAVDLAAAPSQGLALSTEEGTVKRQSATLLWVDIGSARAPAYPG